MGTRVSYPSEIKELAIKTLSKGKLEAVAIALADNAKVAHEMNEKLACDQLKIKHYIVESSTAIVISVRIKQKEERK